MGSDSRSGKILLAPGEWTTIPHAAKHARKAEVTIRRWIKQHGISRQSCPGAPHEVSILALEMVRYGDLAALDLLRHGQKSAPEVRRYFDLLGLPAEAVVGRDEGLF